MPLMYSHKYLYLLTLLSLVLIPFLSVSVKAVTQIEADEEGEKVNKSLGRSPTKLFVFGDSYADTGNTRKGKSSAWKSPYGSTFPGKPAGRFSDGRVLTDYIARYLGLKSPVPYGVRKVMAENNNVKYGMNMAFGGAGVFDTGNAVPNVSTQIDYLERLIDQKLYSTNDITNSVALLSLAGNDYVHFLTTNASLQDLPSFIESVVKETIRNMIRIHELGVKKIAVNNLEPLGCLPVITALSSFEECNAAFNAPASLHNALLNQQVRGLNRNGRPTFVVLDFYSSFKAVLNHPSTYNINRNNPLKPCCVGSCGSSNKKGKKYYKVCDDPTTAFFWDSVHPSQAGWRALYNYLRTMIALPHLRTIH